MKNKQWNESSLSETFFFFRSHVWLKIMRNNGAIGNARSDSIPKLYSDFEFSDFTLDTLWAYMYNCFVPTTFIALSMVRRYNRLIVLKYK